MGYRPNEFNIVLGNIKKRKQASKSLWGCYSLCDSNLEIMMDHLESQKVQTLSVAKESHNQTFRFDIQFNLLKFLQSRVRLHGPIDVESCRTQVKKHIGLFIVRNGRQITELLQNDPTHTDLPEHVSRNLQWSPLGSYLLQICKHTIFLSGGDRRAPIMRYIHDMVERVDFSPGEKYLVSYSRPEPSNTQELWLKIFEVRTGRLLTGLDGHVAADWPVIRWAGGKDDKYFATLSKNNVYVYETETFKVLDNKPVDVDGDVVAISWSPTESILALWQRSEVTKIVLVRIPDKKKLIQKDINVSRSDCKMFWQSNGKYLAVQVDRHAYSVFELFFFKEDGIITTESLDVDGKFIAFAWEPSGHRFAVIHGDQSKPHVSFYSMDMDGKNSKLLDTFDGKQADTLYWSPRGKQIVLANLTGGHLEFFDVDKLQTMSTASHPMVTLVAWDPTGRFVATAVIESRETSVVSDPEIDGFKMWSRDGNLRYTVPSVDYRLLQLEWRPYGGIIDDDMLLEYPASDEEDSEDPASDEEDSEDPASDEEDSEDPASDEEDLEDPASDEEDPEDPASDEEDSEDPASDEEDSEDPASDEEDLEDPASDEEDPEDPASDEEDSEDPASDEENSEDPASDEEDLEDPASDEEDPEDPASDEEDAEYPTSDEEDQSSG